MKIRNKNAECHLTPFLTQMFLSKIPIMSIRLESASRVTEFNCSADDDTTLEVMETRRSSKLARLMKCFRNPERRLYSYEDLMHLGITVICLPEADHLLTNRGPFQPHCSFRLTFIKELNESLYVGNLCAYGRMQFKAYMEVMGFTDCVFPWYQVW